MSSAMDEFENAFQSCVTALTNSTTNYPHDPEEVKTTADQTVQRFLDSAKAMECFFLQKRLHFSVHNPDQLVKEDIDDIKIEIQRKDIVIHKFQEKLQMWQRMLSDQPQPATPITQMPSSAGHPLAQISPHPNMQQHLQQRMMPNQPQQQPPSVQMRPQAQHAPMQNAPAGPPLPMPPADTVRPYTPQMGTPMQQMPPVANHPLAQMHLMQSSVMPPGTRPPHQRDFRY
jgi:hypothetical protein